MHEVLNLAEAREYLSGDTLQCLLCGKHLKALGWHLRSMHRMGAREYKERFGLGYSKGLVGVATAAAQSRAAIADGRADRNLKPVRAEAQRRGVAAARRSAATGVYRTAAQNEIQARTPDWHRPFTIEELALFVPDVTVPEVAKRLDRQRTVVWDKFIELGIVPKRCATGRIPRRQEVSRG